MTVFDESGILPAVRDLRRPADCCPPPVLRPARRGRSEESLLAALRALADPTRLRILRLLASAGRPVCVCDLVPAVGVRQPTVSHHLAILRRAGLVDGTRRGIWAHYALRPAGLHLLREGLAGLAPPGRPAEGGRGGR